MKISPFEAYRTFQSIKFHLTKEKFCLPMQTRTSFEKFEKSHYTYIFRRLATIYSKEEYQDFCVANIIVKPTIPFNDLISTEAREIYLKYKKEKESMSYIFTQDLQKIKNRGTMAKLEHNGLPAIVNMCLSKEISINTVVIMDILFGILARYNTKVKEEFIWPEVYLMLTKLKYFFSIDTEKYKEIIRNGTS